MPQGRDPLSSGQRSGYFHSNSLALKTARLPLP